MGKTVTAVIAELILAGFGYLLITSDLDPFTKGFGMLVLVIAISAIALPGKTPQS